MNRPCPMCARYRPLYRCVVYDMIWEPGVTMELCDDCICVMRDMRRHVTVEEDEYV